MDHKYLLRAWSTALALTTVAFLGAGCGGKDSGAHDAAEDQEARIEGEVLVGVSPSALATPDVQARLAEYGTVDEIIGDVVRLKLGGGRTVDDAVANLRGTGIAYVEPNYVTHGYASPTEGNGTGGAPTYGTAVTGQAAQWSGAVKAELEAAWGRTSTPWTAANGTPIIIAVVDSGMQTDHPDIPTAKQVNGYDFVAGAPITAGGAGGGADANGHGTQVAGIAAASTNNQAGIAGIAGWDGDTTTPHVDTTAASTLVQATSVVKLMPVKVMAGTTGTHANLAKGILWAVGALTAPPTAPTRAANVILVSLGSAAPSWTLQKAIETAWANNAIVIAAAGNNSTSLMRYPAAYQGAKQNVVSVGSVDNTDSIVTTDAVAAPNINPKAGSNYGAWVNLLAPGYQVWATDRAGAYAQVTGNSYAAAWVAGGAAFIWAKYTPAAGSAHVQNSLTNAELRKILVSSVNTYNRDDGRTPDPKDASQATKIAVKRTIATTGGRFNVQAALEAAALIAPLANGATVPPVLASVSLSATSTAAGLSVDGLVQLTDAIATNGSAIDVALTSGNTIVTVPAKVTIAAGQKSASFKATVAKADLAATVTITASTTGTNAATATTSLNVQAPGIAGITYDKSTVTGGGTIKGTVKLTAPMSTAQTINLQKQAVNNAYALPSPATVTIPAGSTSAIFTLTTTPQTADTAELFVQAQLGSGSFTPASPATGTGFKVLAPQVKTISFSPAKVYEGQAVTATVTLTGATPTGGLNVNLSADPAVTLSASSISFTQDDVSQTVTITPEPAAVQAAVPVTAWVGNSGTQITANLTVLPLLANATLNPATIVGGGSTLLTVTLAIPAPAAVTIDLTPTGTDKARVNVGNGNGGASTLTIAKDATSASVTVTTTNTSPTSATVPIDVSYHGVVKTLNLTVTAPTLSSITLSKTTALVGDAVTITATLTAAAVAATDVVITTTDATIFPVTGLSGPTSGGSYYVTVLQGQTSVTSSAITLTDPSTPLATTKTITIGGTANGVKKTAAVQVSPALPTISVSFPGAVAGGLQNATGTVTLSKNAPTGGMVIVLSSANTNVVTVPSSVTISAGQKTATFTATTKPQQTGGPIVISAVYNNGTPATANLTVNNPLSAVNLGVGGTSLAAAATTTGTVDLAAAAGGSGATVTLDLTADTAGASCALTNTPTVLSTIGGLPTVSVAASTTGSTGFTVTNAGSGGSGGKCYVRARVTLGSVTVAAYSAQITFN